MDTQTQIKNAQGVTLLTYPSGTLWCAELPYAKLPGAQLAGAFLKEANLEEA
ncbi:hypothetical protein UFOVP1288_81, partial [uncultured Caudovirales phage]